jgi:cytochrome b561
MERSPAEREKDADGIDAEARDGKVRTSVAVEVPEGDGRGELDRGVGLSRPQRTVARVQQRAHGRSASLVLVFVVVRFVNRQVTRLPPFPETMSAVERAAATWSERLLYALLFLMPLIGWGMLSAARYPIVLFGSIHLPPILPHSTWLYTVLRTSHTVFAYLLFFAFMAHLSAVLFHTLVLRDGLLRRMSPTPTLEPETRPSGAGHPARART